MASSGPQPELPFSDASPPDHGATSVSKKQGQRVRIGLGIAAISLFAIFMGSWIWAVFVVIFLVMGFNELTAMMAALNTSPSKFIVLVMGILMIVVATLNHPEFLSPLLTITVVGSFFRLLFRNPVGSMADIGATLLAVVYLAYFPVHFIMLRELSTPTYHSIWNWGPYLSPTAPFFQAQPGLGYLVLTIVVVGMSDIAAYYTGKQFGRSLLYPQVSPKKTREGALGGVLVGFAAGALMSWVIGFPLQHGLILSLLLTIVGQIGDLIESVFKRNAGIKDSSALLQGHGGLLDRMDSYIFSGVIAYYYIYWIVLGLGLARDIRHAYAVWF
ncbi:MAG: phosphatidate cytidylyltransferase [Vampirovibrionales bacterium]|nr:phosphatidate cytidylyltransferase [Vampirovibrionales bacterium]